MGDERTDSMCAVWADLIEQELSESEPDMRKVEEWLGYIRTYCQTVGYAPGDVPDHLEEYTYGGNDA